MRLGLAILLSCALAAAVLPAAGAKPGNGNGKGPPAWAGAGNGGGNVKAKGQDKKAEQAARKQERRAADEGAADGPKHDNPAWVCKTERERMGADAFADEYGENDNKANAFGKCVSREAHDRDGVTPGEEPEPEAPAAPDEPVDEEAAPADALAALQAFFQALRQLML